jgi:PAS domain S-box-containing protein
MLISTFILLIVLGFSLVFPQVSMDTLINEPFSVLLVFAVMLHILKSYRGTVEQDRQRDLREQEERYHALLETSYEGICLQMDGKIIEANPGFCRLFGFNAEEVFGLDVRSLFVEGDRAALLKNDKRVLEGQGETHLVKCNGAIFPAVVVSYLQHNPNQTVEVLAIRDISARRGAEESLQRAYDEMENRVEERTLELTQANVRLMREVEDRKEAEKLQGALYLISEAAYMASGVQELFPAIHQIIAQLTPARNLYFALYDAARDEVSFPYFVDEFDNTPPVQPLGQGPTDWIIRHGEPLLLLTENLKHHASILAFSGGAQSDNWLGVPLKKNDGKTIGALVVQNYAHSEMPGRPYTESDKIILSFVSTQVAMSIERQRAEQNLALSEERFRSISEIATDFAYSYLIDETGKLELEWINGAFAAITGYAVEELDRENFFNQKFFHPDDMAILRRRQKKLLSNQVDTSDIRIVTKNGEKRTLRLVSRPQYDSQKGRVARVLSTAQDISERKKVELELLKAHQDLEQRVAERTLQLAQANETLQAKIVTLQETEQALHVSENALLRLLNENKQLILSIQSILIGVDSMGRITHWNAAAAEILGFPTTDMIEVPFFDLPLNWDWSVVRDGIISCLQRGEIVHLNNIQFFRPDGAIYFLDLTLSPLVDHEGCDMGFLLVGMDITQRRIMEQQMVQMHKLESIGQLAAGIAHEINTPTQYVTSNLHFMAEQVNSLLQMIELYQMAIQRVKDGKVMPQEAFEEIEEKASRLKLTYILNEFPLAIQQSVEGVDRINHIVRAMGEFSYPGTDKAAQADVNRLLESTIEVCRNEWKYMAELQTDLDPALPMIECYPAELNQAFLNVIINAVHAIEDVLGRGNQTEKGIIRITSRSSENRVEVRIADTGTGISEKVSSRIFDPFFTTKEVGRGTGQGLSITHNVVVNKHHGSIRFETEMGKGTTFIILLPVRQADLSLARLVG